MLYILFFTKRSHSGVCESTCVGRVVITKGGQRTGQMLVGAVACNCRVECEMRGRGNGWMRSMKTPSQSSNKTINNELRVTWQSV